MQNTLFDEPVIIESTAPINAKNLSRQNRMLFDALMAEESMDHYRAADIGIGVPHSRFSDIRSFLKRNGVDLKYRNKTKQTRFGSTAYREFFISPSDKDKLKK